MKLNSLFILIFLFFNLLCFTQNDTTKIVVTNKLAWELRTSNPDTSILLSKQVLVLLNKISHNNPLPENWKEKGLAKTLYYLGTFYSYKNEYDTAFDYFEKALDISTKTDYLFIVSQTYGGMGNVYYAQGSLPKALEYYLKALEIDEKRGFKKGISVHLANIGNIYEEKHNSQKALEYYNKALNIALEINDQERVAIQLGNIGVVYHTLNNLPKALEYYSKALELNKTFNNKIQISNNLSNMASVYMENKNYQKALDYFNESMQLAAEIGDETGILIGNIGVIHFLMKDYKTAEKYLLKAIAVSEEINDLQSLKEFEEALSNVYSAQGKDKLALVHF